MYFIIPHHLTKHTPRAATTTTASTTVTRCLWHVVLLVWKVVKIFLCGHVRWLLDRKVESWNGRGGDNLIVQVQGLRIYRVVVYRVLVFVICAICKCKATRSSYYNVDKALILVINTS